MTKIRELKNLLEHFGLDGKIIVTRQTKNKKYALAQWVIDNAIKSGQLKPGQPIVEATAGNFGIGMAILAKKYGYPFYAVATVPKMHNNAEAVISAYGGKVIKAPFVIGKSTIDTALEKAQQLTQELGAYCYDQFKDESHVEYYERLAYELLDGFDEKIDCYIDRVGSGATMAGFAKVLKEKCNTKSYYATKKNVTMPMPYFFANRDIGHVWLSNEADLPAFEEVLWQTERLKDLEYSAISLFCAVEWLKQNKGKTVFVFIGD